MKAWMWDVRALVSLLLERGHSECRHYPLGMLMDEARLVNRRDNNRYVTESTLLQSAVSGVLSKKANKHFRDHINRLLKG